MSTTCSKLLKMSLSMNGINPINSIPYLHITFTGVDTGMSLDVKMNEGRLSKAPIKAQMKKKTPINVIPPVRLGARPCNNSMEISLRFNFSILNFSSSKKNLKRNYLRYSQLQESLLSLF